MRRFELPRRVIDAFASAGVQMDLLPYVAGASRAEVRVALIEPGGTIGRHRATRSQAFAVVAGEGEVAAADEVRHPLQAGHVVVWEAGELHQSWATTAMTVVIVETDGRIETTEHHREL
ncbi:cupin domain-containing protein [Occultella glacieicola]|uniref:Cupin domain-containing protein n=1 Tax=Occultella glacieicola TaxID=2518684 RepID=A0ABY2E169_9MICO|nr:cupin domain-containing protein [Occultella glacieicola]TDE91673.1 cupin domain-containing protein [Occultella glacieicola]